MPRRTRRTSSIDDPQFQLICVSCGAAHPPALQENWGQQGFGDGLGPIPCCTELREDNRGAGYVCRGQLVAMQVLSTDNE